MNVAIIGISGRVGSRVANELLARGHTVTGIARRVAAPSLSPGLTLVPADAGVASELIPILRGHDAVINATRFVGTDAGTLISAVRKSGVARLLIVGGAASLEVAPGLPLLESRGFPAAYKEEATAGCQFLQTLRGTPDLDWTFLSPSAEFAPGVRTGKFRVGGDQLLADGQGRSHISMEDFAIAMVDELELPVHSRRRFTVGY
jgi:putative NADH-flavin reductase